MPETTEREIIDGSFTIEQEVRIEAPREHVFDSLTDVSGWWTHHHGDQRPEMLLEPKIGGRFCELWGDDQGALWGTVTLVKRPERIRLSGPLGMDLPVAANFEFRLEEDGDATILHLTHRCIGALDTRWEDGYTQGWQELWVTLKAFAERGERVG